jgi:hypothetical protein
MAMAHVTSRDERERWRKGHTAEAPLPVAKADLQWAAGQGVIAPGQVEPLWQALAGRTSTPAAAAVPAVERALLGWLPDPVRRALPMQRKAS